MNFAFITLAILTAGLATERIWRLNDQRRTLTQKSIMVALMSVGIGGVAYGIKGPVTPYFDLGNLVWHVAATVLIGALEMIFLTLRVEQVRRGQVTRTIVCSALVVLLVLVTWPVRLADSSGARGVEHFSEHNLASIATLVVFPLYVIWGLSQIVFLSIRRIPQDIRRRPINTLAFALVATGLTGFILINAVTLVLMNTGRGSYGGSIVAYAPLALGICVAGAALLAVGERTYEELAARYQLSHLSPLWLRMIELSPQGLHLPAQDLSSPARLQRAYVEISDAICTLRIPHESGGGVESIVSALRHGDVSDDPSAPTLSQSLHARNTRREDLLLIGALAEAYRR